jgi:uncharacterized membrane protein YraQ (UPF0718 family)
MSEIAETYLVISLLMAVFAAVAAVGTALVLGVGFERLRNGFEIVRKQTAFFSDAIRKLDDRTESLDGRATVLEHQAVVLDHKTASLEAHQNELAGQMSGKALHKRDAEVMLGEVANIASRMKEQNARVLKKAPQQVFSFSVPYSMMNYAISPRDEESIHLPLN